MNIIKIKNITNLYEAEATLQKYTKAFIIDDNFFTVSKIMTMFKPVIQTKVDKSFYFEEFVFSYADANINDIFKVRFYYKPTSFFDFLKTAQYLNEQQLDKLADDRSKYLHAHPEFGAEDEDNYDDPDTWGRADDNLDKMMYNEALIYILSSVNKDDVNITKEDVWEKFIKWREEVLSENDEFSQALYNLYQELLSAKLRSIEA